MDCATPISRSIAGSGEPGGGLPAGGDPGDFLQFNGVLWVPSWMMPLVVTALEAGEILLAVGPDTAEFQTPVGRSLFYHNATTTFVVGNVWMPQWNGFSSNLINQAGFAVALRSGTLRWLRTSHGSPEPIADIIQYTVVVNGVSTSLTVSLPAAESGPVSNTQDSVVVNQGDLISMRGDGATQNQVLRARADFLLEY